MISRRSASSTVVPGRQRHLRLVLHRRLVRQRRRQVPRLDERAGRQNRRPLDDVAQLAHVARPVVLLEHPHRLLIDAGDRLLIAQVELVQERLHQQRQIVAPVAQRRQADREHVQAVEQVFAQLALLHRFERIDVGRGDDAHVDRLLVPAAEAAEAALLQHAQQLDLRRRRHLADLVEKQRAAIGELEAALAAIGRAGERALLVAEDLALEQRFGNGGAVDGDKRERRRAD